MVYNKFKMALFIFCFALFFSNEGLAQNKKHDPKEMRPTFEELLKKMDTDENGSISKSEAKGPLKKDFAKIDANEDGFIGKEEFEKAPKPRRSPKKSK